MLVILFGTSCVGKTTLIRGLIRKYNYNYVSCYTTRPPRENDIGRYSVTFDEFQRLASDNKFMLINNNFNYLYGTPLDEIENAVYSKEFFVVDFMIKDQNSFDSFKCTKIVVVPENVTQLRKQIIAAGRLNRMDDILQDYAQNFNLEKIDSYRKRGFKIFQNTYDAINNNVKFLHNLII